MNREQLEIRRKYVGLRHDEIKKRDGFLRELEAERKKAIKDVEDHHKGEVHMVHEAFGQNMAELAAQEADEIEGAQK